MGIITVILDIINKLLGLKSAQLADKDKINAAKAEALVKTDSANEVVVQKAAVKGASLDELRKMASE